MLLIRVFLRLCQYRHWPLYTIIFLVNGIEMIKYASNNEIRNESSARQLGSSYFERFVYNDRLPYTYVLVLALYYISKPSSCIFPISYL